MGLYKADILIVGAGFSGAAFARYAADAGYKIYIIDKRDHVGGNCYSYQDEETGIEIHKYGPHIFHTSSELVWKFINRFTTFNNYVNRVKAKSNKSIYTLPINLHTINQFFKKSFSPNEAKKFIEKIRVKNIEINNFENYILHSLGVELYEAFFKYYTIKQWGITPKEIPVSTAKRVPIRFNYNDNYYNDSFQGIPIEGYTIIFDRMLNHKNIKVLLKNDFSEYKKDWRKYFKYLVYTGSLDEFYDYKYGYLPYRSVYFEEIRANEIQGNAVINYTDLSEKFTRIHEHKYFTPEKKFTKSVGFKEFTSSTDSRKDPIYPVRNEISTKIYQKYQNMSNDENDIIFLGRLADFKYYDMDQVIALAISKFDKIKKR